MHNLLITVTSVVGQAEAQTEGSGGIGAIGINVKALVFQLINFAILLWVLKRVAYKPILKILEDRRQTIEESLKTAREIEQASRAISQKQEQLLKEARTAAEKITTQSQAQAADLIAKAEANAKKRAAQVTESALGQIEQQVVQARQELKQETLRLVAQATAVLIEEKLDPQKDGRLMEKALSGEEK